MQMSRRARRMVLAIGAGVLAVAGVIAALPAQAGVVPIQFDDFESNPAARWVFGGEGAHTDGFVEGPDARSPVTEASMVLRGAGWWSVGRLVNIPRHGRNMSCEASFHLRSNANALISVE